MVKRMMAVVLLFISPTHAMDDDPFNLRAAPSCVQQAVDDLRATPPRVQKTQTLKIIKAPALAIHKIPGRKNTEYNLFLGHMKASPKRIKTVEKKLATDPQPVPEEYIDFIRSNDSTFSSRRSFYQFSIDGESGDIRILSLLEQQIIYRKINHLSLRKLSV